MARCESTWRDGKYTEMSAVKTSVQSTGKRRIRNDDEVIITNFVVEGVTFKYCICS